MAWRPTVCGRFLPTFSTWGGLPSLVVDGGVSDGVLGLSGILANRFEVPSLGYIPLQGLSSIGPRTRLVVHKDTYLDREILVGLTPDVLVCVGGGLGTQRECEAALEHGGVVLLLALRDYGPGSLPSVYLEHSITKSAARDGRLIVCSNVRDIQTRLPRIIQTARLVSLPSRSQRMEELSRQLT